MSAGSDERLHDVHHAVPDDHHPENDGPLLDVAQRHHEVLREPAAGDHGGVASEAL